MTKLLGGWKRAVAVFLACSATPIVSSAQMLTTLVNFAGINGDNPEKTPLVQGFDGNFYGTTAKGGANNSGTVFEMTPSGTLTVIYSFCALANCADGSVPIAGLVQATDGNLYGTTSLGGACANCYGTVFKITPGGTLTTLHSFCPNPNCKDGGYPYGGLVQATDGNFYGTTWAGGGGTYCGVDENSVPCGTVFRITPSGNFATLYSFCTQRNCIDGAAPEAPLIQGNDGSLYGTTSEGGSSSGTGPGTVFKIEGRTLTTLSNFGTSGGALPTAGLVQGTNGSFYGTTDSGGSNTHCEGCGTVYQMTPKGELRAVSFNGVDGEMPTAGLIQATDGTFYGTTTAGGSGAQCNDPRSCGTIFKITPLGGIETVYSFCVQANCPDGYQPSGDLVQGTDGNLYGTTNLGGSSNLGTVFVLSVGLGPFVKTLTTSGAVGTSVIILGTGLTGASGVSFNGTPAAFTVVSASEITTTVPAGATTGTVQVTTPSGALLSNVVFRVTP